EGVHVDRQIPGGVPRILPLVRHRDHIAVVEVNPPRVATLEAALRRRRVNWIPFQPMAHRVMKELLCPEEPAIGLPDDRLLVACEVAAPAGRIEHLGLGYPVLEYLVESLPEETSWRFLLGKEAKPDNGFSLGRQAQNVVRGGLRSGARGIDRIPPPFNQELMECIF